MSERRMDDALPPRFPSIRIWLCGSFTIEWVEPETGRGFAMPDTTLHGRGATPALSLLKLLLCQPNRQAHRDWIMEQFWPESTRTTASHRLENIASTLRKLLYTENGEHLLSSLRGNKESGTSYQLPPYPRLWVDADALVWNVEQAVRMERFDDNALPFWQRAYDLAQRGPFLAHELYASWSQAQRAKIEGHYRQCVHSLSHVYTARGDEVGQAEALLLLRSYWVQHKTDEDVLRPLLEVLGAQERYQEAEEYYQQCIDTLEEEESGQQLDPRTRDIYEFLHAKQIERRSLSKNTMLVTRNSPQSLLASSTGRNSSLIVPQVHTIREDDERDKQFDALKRYLQQKKQQLLDVAAPGSTYFRIKDIIDNDGLFISPPWNIFRQETAATDLIDDCTNKILKREQILLLGEAGQGKTTILMHVFIRLVNRFLNSAPFASPLPLYIPLRELHLLPEDRIKLLWFSVQDTFPLPFEEFVVLAQQNLLVALFDGFDEIDGECTQRAVNERAGSKLFTFPSLLSCRKNFYELYLSQSVLQGRCTQIIELQPLQLTYDVHHYIRTFCQKKQAHKDQKLLLSPEQIIETISASQQLQDLAQRPLLLMMMLDIFTDPQEIMQGIWDVTTLYQKYMEKWLKSEAAKPDSLLRWDQKARFMQEIAWFTYTTGAPTSSPYKYHEHVVFSYQDITFVAEQYASRYQPLSPLQLLDDLCLRTFLVVSREESYTFIHKSFHEYYMAKYIFECLRRKDQRIDLAARALQAFLPFEIVTFLKEMLTAKTVSHRDRDIIVETLITAYQQSNASDGNSTNIRQHASYYLAFLGTQRAVSFLEQTYEQEPNKWVQRGMMVGLALFCERADILERYIMMIKTDAEAASINVGYHLVYYGDQPQEMGYCDQGGERCEGALTSIFRRLKRERYKTEWVLDLVTLSSLLERRGFSLLSSREKDLHFLKEFLQKDNHIHSQLLYQEKQHLAEMLQGVRQ